jgi:predicted Zn-dependent peptidase
MYDDSPADRCFYGMLEGMYENHSIRRNICGSVDSITKITADTLYSCYDAFYNPQNMALIICGDVVPQDVIAIANEHLPCQKKPFVTFTSDENASENRDAFKKLVRQKMQVSKPIFNIGFKDIDIPSDPTARQKKDAVMAILDEMIFSRAGELYNYLYENDFISPNMSYGYSISKCSAYNSIAGEADDPQAVLNEIMRYIDQLRQRGLDREDFLRGKRVMYAEFVKSFDSTDGIANNLFAFFCEDSELLAYANVIESVSFEDVCSAFENCFDRNTVTLSVVEPL